MQNLSKISKAELLKHAHSLVTEERKISLLMIDCLRECERRLLHLEQGCSSLWQFSVEILKLSEGAAQRYISAMRLTVAVPEAKVSLENGTLSLVNAAALQSHFRSEKKYGHEPTQAEKQELIEKVQGLSKKECEQELLKLSPHAIPPEKKKPLTETLTELRFVVDRSVLKRLEKLTGLLGHKMPQASLAEIFDYLVCEELKRQEKKKAGVVPKPPSALAKVKDSDSSQKNFVEVLSPVAVKVRRSVIPTPIRRAIWTRSGGRCEFISTEGKRCSSSYQLEFDHFKTPVGLGGGNEEAGIRIACRAHNMGHAVFVYGENSMKKWLPRLK